MSNNLAEEILDEIYGKLEDNTGGKECDAATSVFYEDVAAVAVVSPNAKAAAEAAAEAAAAAASKKKVFVFRVQIKIKKIIFLINTGCAVNSQLRPMFCCL